MRKLGNIDENRLTIAELFSPSAEETEHLFLTNVGRHAWGSMVDEDVREHLRLAMAQAVDIEPEEISVGKHTSVATFRSVEDAVVLSDFLRKNPNGLVAEKKRVSVFRSTKASVVAGGGSSSNIIYRHSRRLEVSRAAHG